MSRNFIIERHSNTRGWEVLDGQLKTWKAARDAAKIYTETTGRITRVKKTSKTKSEVALPDAESWLSLHNLYQY